MVDFEMARRLSRIQDEHEGKIVWLPPSLHLDCGKRLVTTRWWYESAGFVAQERLNYWLIPKET